MAFACCFLALFILLLRLRGVSAENPLYAPKPPISRASAVDWYDGWTHWNVTRRYYKLIKAEASWDQAELECQRRGAHLVSIHSWAENQFVFEKLILKEAEKNVWIGAHRLGNIKLFAWTDGSKFDYEHWGPEEPDNGQTEACVEMKRSDPGSSRWFTEKCQLAEFVCVKSGDRVTLSHFVWVFMLLVLAF